MHIFVCLLDDLILGFCYSNLTRETGRLELAPPITLVLQANRLTNCPSQPNTVLNKLFGSSALFYKKRRNKVGSIIFLELCSFSGQRFCKSFLFLTQDNLKIWKARPNASRSSPLCRVSQLQRSLLT